MKKLLTLAGMFAAGSAYAAGYGVDTQAARATGMATAVTASIDDASAVFYNPAGIVQGKGVEIYLGDTLVIPAFNAEYQGHTFDAKRAVVPPPHAYITWGITDNLSVGLGLFSPYGSALSWHGSFAGRFLAESSSLSTYFLNPEVAYKFGPVKIGAGVQIVRGTVELTQGFNFVDSEGSATIAGGGWGVGGNAGAQVEIVPKTFFAGLTYRSAVALPLSGAVHFANVPAEYQGQLKDQNVKTAFTLPDSATLAVAYFPVPILRLGLDVNYTAWQRFHDLAVNFDDSSLDTTTEKRWTHTFNYHLGGELTIARHFDVRAGVIYDPTPSPVTTLSPDLPDANRVNIALGLGYHGGGFRADLGYQLVLLTPTTSQLPQFPATYSGLANVIGYPVGYRFN